MQKNEARIDRETVTIPSEQICKTGPRSGIIEASDIGLNSFPEFVKVLNAKGTAFLFKVARPILIGQGEDMEVAGYEYRSGPTGYTLLIQND